MVNKKTDSTTSNAASQPAPNKTIKKASARNKTAKGAFGSITATTPVILSNVPSSPKQLQTQPPPSTQLPSTPPAAQSSAIPPVVAPVAAAQSTTTSSKPKKAPLTHPDHPGVEPKKYKNLNVYFLVDELGYKITVQRHGRKGGTFNSASPKYAAHKAVTRKVANPIRIRKSGSKWFHVYEGERIAITDDQRSKNKFMEKVPVLFRPKVHPIGTKNIKEEREAAAKLAEQSTQTQGAVAATA